MTQKITLNKKWGLVILIAFQTVLGSVYISDVPRIYVDEVWDSSLGCSLANTGSLKHPFIEGFGGMHIHFVQSRIILPIACAAIFKIAGYSVAASRAGSLGFGVLAVISLYFVTRRWFGERQAFWIALATILNPWFFEVSRRARPEIYYTALALVFLWLLVIFSDSGSRRSAFFAGIIAGLSALTHPNGLIITFSIGCAVIVWLRPKSRGRLIQWAFIGFLLSILPYIIYVLWATQDPLVSFTEQMEVGRLYKSFLQNEIIRWRGFFKWPKGAPLAIVMLVSWILAWYRSSGADKVLATIIALFSLTLPFATVSPTCRYLTTIVPFSCALIVRFIWRIKTEERIILKDRHKFRLAINTTIVIIYLLTCTTAIGLMFYRLRGADFSKVINRVASVVGPDSRVYGDPIFWAGHKQYKYGPWKTFKVMRGKEANEWARKYHFDYVIRTAWTIGDFKGIAKPPESMPVFRIDYSLIDYFCVRFGIKVDEFRDPYYGPIEIYKLDWNKTNKVQIKR